jgi:hypothetical protein
MSDSSERDETGSSDTDQDKGGPKPTIVGSQPSANSTKIGGIPLGVETLIKKASIDEEFRRLLLEKRADAAREIDLELTAVEAAMLKSIPRSQIEQIIGKTTVPKEHRRVFLGKVGAAMLAVLSLDITAYAWEFSAGVGADGATFRVKEGPVVIVNSGRPLFEVKVADTGPDSVTVTVRYVSIFDDGLFMIYFIDQHKKFVDTITYRPEVHFVSRGVGEVTFQGTGTNPTTEWLVTSLISTEPPCSYEVPGSISDYLSQHESREYFIGDRIVWNVLKFHKEWIPKG